MASLIDLVIGVIWGAVSGFFGGKVDEYMMRIADILYGVPYLLVVILLMVVMPQGLWTMIIAMTITGWISMARIVRGQVMQLKSEEYVMASKSLGASNSRLLFQTFDPQYNGSDSCYIDINDSNCNIYRSIFELSWFRCTCTPCELGNDVA